jgi:hypothetical protein
MKRIVSTAIVAITAIALSATLVLAADPVPNDQGVRISAIANAVDYVSGRAKGAAVSAAAKLHGKAVSAAARLKQHGASAAGGHGKPTGAGANAPSIEPGNSAAGDHGPPSKETGRLKGAAASENGKANASTGPAAVQSHNPTESPSK